MEYRFTKENFESEVLRSDVPVLVDFYADWCGPCRAMMPVVEQLAGEYDGRVKVGVMSIPSFFIIKDGKVVDQLMGGMPKEMLAQHIDAQL